MEILATCHLSVHISMESNDIRAWIAFGGLGPTDTQIESKSESLYDG